MSDIHLTDKEAPNQFIHNQQEDSSCRITSLYSPVMVYTPQVFDAAIQTVNALHTKKNYDFGISLGDVSNTAMYNDLICHSLRRRFNIMRHITHDFPIH